MMEELVLYDHKGRAITSLEGKRNLVYSSTLRQGMPRAVYNDLSVKRAVKDGMKSSVWVYRSNDLISFQASSVPFDVTDLEGERIDSHPLQSVLDSPNPQLSRRDVYQLIYLWMMLAGVGYFKKIPSGNAISGFWPVSPDRIVPIRSRDVEYMIDGYGVSNDRGGDIKVLFQPEEIIAFKLLDPSNPTKGISPLQACSKIVDIDNDQQDFAKSAMQNNGVLEGIVSFKQPLTRDQLLAQKESWQERNSGTTKAKSTAFVGGDASYTRLSSTPAEMDYKESRKNNRDEILAAHGVSPQLVGAQEASTYNNLAVSELILWRSRIMPLISIVTETLTFSLRLDGLLTDDQKVTADYSNVAVLQQVFSEQSETVKRLYDSGVPMQEINRKLRLGLSEYPGWDLPFTGLQQVSNPSTESRGETRAWKPQLNARAKELDIEKENEEKDALAEKHAEDILSALKSTEAKIESSMDKILTDVEKTVTAMVKAGSADLESALTSTFVDAGITFANQIVVETRDAFDDLIAVAVGESLEKEKVILTDLAFINETTAARVIEQVTDGIDNGLSIQDIKQSIQDTGVFSPERALRIARTSVGTGASMGQLAAATLSGATKKVWRDSVVNVRDLHIRRRGETVDIDKAFTRVASGNGEYPRYPLDPNMSAEDRINCRCAMTFR